MINWPEWARRFAAARTSLALTQHSVAQRVGSKFSTYQAIESGRTRPSLEGFIDLVRLLGIDVNRLIHADGSALYQPSACNQCPFLQFVDTPDSPQFGQQSCEHPWNAGVGREPSADGETMPSDCWLREKPITVVCGS